MSQSFPNVKNGKFAAGLTEAIRRPMFVAVAASAVVHGLFFVALPAVTTPISQQKDPERVVNVIELTPEEQARLPQTMALNQFPLPAGATGKLPPLSGLNRKMQKSKTGSLLPPLNPPNPAIDDILKDLQKQPKISFVPQPGPLFKPVPLPKRIFPKQNPKRQKTVSPLQQLKQAEAADPKPEKTPELPKLEQNQPLPENPKLPPGTLAKNPDPTPEASPSPTPTPSPTPSESPASDGGASDLSGTTPAVKRTPQSSDVKPADTETPQQLAARTYNPAQATDEVQKEQQQKITAGVLDNLATQLEKLPEKDQRLIAREFGLAALGMDQPIILDPVTPQLSPGAQLNFGQQKRPEKIMAVVQVYFAPDGSLIAATEVDGEPSAAPVLMRSSGFQVLDQQALEVVQKQIEADPPKAGQYQTRRYEIPFAIPETGEA